MAFPSDTSSEWVRCARAGDPKAVERLCAKYRGPLKQYVESHMGARARRWTDPEDIVQTSLMEVIGRLETLPDQALGRAFEIRLRRVARQRIVDDLRSHGRDKGASVAPELDPEANRRSEGAVTAADTHRWLAGLVERLPDKYRDVVRLCAFEGCDYEEAARRLGLNAEAVRKRYERAREALALKLTSRQGPGGTRGTGASVDRGDGRLL